MNRATEESIQKAVETLAAKLGVAADVVWEALLRQAPIAATSNLIASAVGVALCVTCWGIFVWSVKRLHEDDTNELAGGLLIGSGIFGLVAMLVTVLETIGRLPITLAGFYNPSYWALHEVARLLR